MLESNLTRAVQRDLPASRRVRLGIMVVVGIVSLFAAACSSTAATPKRAGQGKAAAAAAASSAQVTITPANGATGAKPDQGISVTAAAGKISNVTVTPGNAQVGGIMAADATSWHTHWSLRRARTTR